MGEIKNIYFFIFLYVYIPFRESRPPTGGPNFDINFRTGALLPLPVQNMMSNHMFSDIWYLKTHVLRCESSSCVFTSQKTYFPILDIGKHVLRNRFVLGVEEDTCPEILSKFVCTPGPGIFTTTGRIRFYNSWKETFGKLQMHCSEFQQWLIHLNSHRCILRLHLVRRSAWGFEHRFFSNTGELHFRLLHLFWFHLLTRK
jgi:hypothetical protein